MRRLARRLFTLCSALSLLMCVAVCVLWLRSYEVDVFNWYATVPDPASSGPDLEREDYLKQRIEQLLQPTASGAPSRS